jgi:hypothetical protein
MSPVVHCDLCRRVIPLHAHYILKMEIFADPATPPLLTNDPTEPDFDKHFAALLQELERYSTEELEELIHKRFEYRLCAACQRTFLANPLGLPRATAHGAN